MTDREAMQAAADKEQEDQDKAAKAKTWKPTKAGEEMYGVLLEGEWVDTKYGETRVLTVEDEDGGIHTVWGSGIILEAELNLKNPKIGSTILLRYTGKQDPKTAGGNQYNGWVLTAPEADPHHWSDSYDRMKQKKKQSNAQQGYAVPDDGLAAPY